MYRNAVYTALQKYLPTFLFGLARHAHINHHHDGHRSPITAVKCSEI